MSRTKIEYNVHAMGEFRCDKCDKFLCFGYMDWCDESGFLCRPCKNKEWMKQAPKRIRALKKKIKIVEKQIKCEHKFNDISDNTTYIGQTFTCSKCDYQYSEPDKFIIEMNAESIGVGGTEVLNLSTGPDLQIPPDIKFRLD